jgi:hypothetical protein
MRQTAWAWIAAALLAVWGAEAARAAAPERIVVGAYINDIQSIDLRADSHVVDFYIWFRWRDGTADATKTIEFMNMVAPDDHVSTKLWDPPKPQPDGSTYTVIRHQGAFSSKFPLRDYPFDTQYLTVELEDSQRGAAQLVFVPEKLPVVLNPDIRLSSYDIGAPRMTVQRRPYTTTFGDLAEPNITAYSRVTITIPITRPWLSGALKVLLPVGLILLSATLALLIRPDHVEARIGLGITALLTLVALQFTASANLPEVDYLMLIDKVYLASYLFIIGVLTVVVRGSWMLEQREASAIARIDRTSGLALVLVYLGTLAALIAPVVSR